MKELLDLMINIAPAIAVVFIVIGLIGYLVAFVLAIFFSKSPGKLGARVKAAIEANPAANIGIPCSALSAFALVSSLWSTFPPPTHGAEKLELRAFGLDFTGPSGPITFWVICFLAFVHAINLLRKR